MLDTFYLLILTHLMGDFLFQGSLSKKKKRFNKYMIAHAAIMAVMFFLPVVNYPAGKVLAGVLFIFAFHLTIDVITIEIRSFLKLKPDSNLFWIAFGIDQMLHITTIYLVYTAVILS